MITRRTFFAAVAAVVAAPVALFGRRKVRRFIQPSDHSVPPVEIFEQSTVAMAKCESCGFEARVSAGNIPPPDVRPLCVRCFETWAREHFGGSVQYVSETDLSALRMTRMIGRDGRPAWWFR